MKKEEKRAGRHTLEKKLKKRLASQTPREDESSQMQKKVNLLGQGQTEKDEIMRKKQ